MSERPVDQFLSEWEFNVLATAGQRDEIPGRKSIENVIAHDGVLLDEFFATLPERIAFWTERCNALWDAHDDVRVGEVQIAAYIERLDWVNLACRNDPEFLALHGHYRFHVVAAALAYGVGPATRYLRFLSGDADDWDYDDEAAAYADDASRSRPPAARFRSGVPTRVETRPGPQRRGRGVQTRTER